MIINWFFSKTYRHKCPDGTIRIIHKNIDSALPLALKDASSKMDAEIAVQKKASAKLKTEYANKINSLLYSISDQNQSLILGFRLAYVAFQSNPCRENEFLFRQAEQLNLGQQRLTELKTQISGLITLAETFPNEPEKVLPLYNDIVGQIGGKSIATSATLSIKENRDNAQKWIGGGNHE